MILYCYINAGFTYDSLSGHAFLVGCRTKKVIRAIVLSKACDICDNVKCNEREEIPSHDCPKNFSIEKSSKSMEAHGAHVMICELYEEHKTDKGYKIEFAELVSDDDSSIRLYLSHCGKNRDEHPNGKLPKHMKKIIFRCDPGHRIKCWAKVFFKLIQTKKGSVFTRSKAARMKRYIGYFIKQNRGKDIQWLMEYAYAPLNHMFNSHELCDPKWCWIKAKHDSGDHSNCKSFWCKRDNNVSEPICKVCPGSGNQSNISQNVPSGSQSLLCLHHGKNNTSYKSSMSYDNVDKVSESRGCKEASEHENEKIAASDNERFVKEIGPEWNATPLSDDDDTIDKMMESIVVTPMVEKYEEAKTLADEENKGNTYEIDDNGVIKILVVDEEENKQLEEDDVKNCEFHYLDMERDKELYETMKNLYDPFCSEKSLRQCMHFWDTQTNECLNLLVSAYAQKSKTYCKSMALTHRVMVAVGVHSVRKESFWKRVRRTIGIEDSEAHSKVLKRHDSKFQKKHEKQKTSSAKKRRVTKKLEKATVQEKKDNMATKESMQYGSGIAISLESNTVTMKTNVLSENEKDGNPTNVGRKSKDESKNTADKKCKLHPFCTVPGHERTSHKSCLFNGKKDAVKVLTDLLYPRRKTKLKSPNDEDVQMVIRQCMDEEYMSKVYKKIADEWK